jgi:hypothetical protein
MKDFIKEVLSDTNDINEKTLIGFMSFFIAFIYVIVGILLLIGWNLKIL